jgi:hypothetical protein
LVTAPFPGIYIQTPAAAWPLAACTQTDNFSRQSEAFLEETKSLGAPMIAVQRALEISRQPVFPKKDVLAVFDISQPSAEKRFYVLDLKSEQVTAHDRDNEGQGRKV